MSSLPPSLIEHTLWEEDKNPIWLGSSLVLQRNFAKYKFPSKLSEAEMVKISTQLAEILQKDLKNPGYLSADKLSPLDKELLFEHSSVWKAFKMPIKDKDLSSMKQAIF